MKTVVQIVVFASTMLSTSAMSKVIYGKDDRIEVYEANPEIQVWARSVATMVAATNIFEVEPDVFELNQSTLAEMLETKQKSLKLKLSLNETNAYGFCSEERFISQPNPGTCSGFLIAPDLLVTAGHCVEGEKDSCSKQSWVFDFQVDKETQAAGVSVKKENIYTCKKVISSFLSIGIDYGVIQLDREVEGRKPLRIRTSGKIEANAPLVIIGSPWGLPLKVAGGAHVRNNADSYWFSANLDSFQGNSGSPVFNALTGVVEGILVRGADDFNLNQEKKCMASNHCEDGSCRGEDASRMTSIPEVLVMEGFFRAAESEDMGLLNKILELKTWVDFYGPDRQSALIKAAIKGKSLSMMALLKNGADVHLTDLSGQTALHHFAKNLNHETKEAFLALLVAGANLNLQDRSGRTPLMLAAMAGNVDGIVELLDKNADASVKDTDGETALYHLTTALGDEGVIAFQHLLSTDE